MQKKRINYLFLFVVAAIVCCACSKEEKVIDGSKAGFLNDRSSGDLVLSISELEVLGMAEPVSLSEIAAKMNSQQRALITGIEIINGGKIADLKGLRSFPNLRNLYIEGSLLIDLKSIETNKLEILSLQNGRLSSLDGIKAMKNLVGLNISGNPIRHLKGINELARLRYVDISKTGITSLDDEDMPTSLETIYYRDSSLTSIAAFQRAFRTLNELDVTHNDISTLDDVTDWGGLKFLNVFLNPLMDKYRDSDGSIPERITYKGITLLFESSEN